MGWNNQDSGLDKKTDHAVHMLGSGQATGMFSVPGMVKLFLKKPLQEKLSCSGNLRKSGSGL